MQICILILKIFFQCKCHHRLFSDDSAEAASLASTRSGGSGVVVPSGGLTKAILDRIRSGGRHEGEEGEGGAGTSKDKFINRLVKSRK